MKLTDEQLEYAAIGRAALLPGMRYIVEKLQAIVDEYRATLEVRRNLKRKPGRPKAAAKATPPPQIERGGWPADPEARKREAARRLRVGRARKKAAAKPTVRVMKQAVA
jgi:hypothetical protein